MFFVVTKQMGDDLVNLVNKIDAWVDKYILRKKPIVEPPINFVLKDARNSLAYFSVTGFNSVPDFSNYQPKPYRWKQC